MRDPRMNQVVINDHSDKEFLNMKEIPEYNLEDWEFRDAKDFSKYIKYLEQITRRSIEYREYIQYLRNAFEMNRCTIYMNVSNNLTNNIKIEIHHDPLTLYDICLIVFRKRQAAGEPLDEDNVAKEVMWLHYNNMVGLIPLSETIHELVHNGVIFIPTTHVFGNYKLFVEAYKPFFTIEQNDMLNEIERASKEFDYDKYKEILAHKELYINDGYSKDLNEEIINLLKDCKKKMIEKFYSRR